MQSINLLCEFRFESVVIESEYVENSNNQILTLPTPKIKNDKGSESYKLIVTTDEKDYLKIENITTKSIFSTKKTENKFGNWKSSDVDILSTSINNEFKYILVADVTMKDYGKSTERYIIDKGSNYFEYNSRSFTKVGSKKIKKEPLSVGFSEDIFSTQKSNGYCKRIDN